MVAGMNAIGWAIAAVSFIGLLDALYFVLVTYRWIRPDPRWLPPVCRMDEGTCAKVVDTKYARILGLPNAVYGLVWFAISLGAGLALGWSGVLPFCSGFAAVAFATVAMSAYLAWALVVRVRTICVLCFLGHGVNAILLALFAVACFL
jgi:uncharacterized membrane protein